MNFEEPTWKRFESLARRILEENNFQIQLNSTRGDKGFDFLGRLTNESWAIEVKYYRTARTRPSLIESAATRVVVNGLRSNVEKGMLVTSSILTSEFRLALEQKYSIVFVDRIDLRNLASTNPSLLDELDALLELDPDFIVDQQSTRLELKNRDKKLDEKPTPQIDSTGTQLCEKLKSIKKGKAHWALYEAICAEILMYLFPNDLKGWHKQKSTDGGASRYDFVCRVSPTTEFWKFLVDNLNSRYIIFEFKNYSSKIKQGQILTTEKYLLERGLRRVAIIFTRLGADKNAISMMQGAMREHGKLILSIDDNEVCNMLQMKEEGDDPTDLLFKLVDDFLLSLPR
ncbi:restriction endonuclease [Pseudomonas sp. zfem005]|uniref:restriction endonuclease n=1 Tax=Pseudomonas sp. zfem005 TaxID=3078200 RepID=UPI0029289F73|nr:restriction endonuclease [Pseudomonas sp. zfem005]MDU9414898.1 restriction endonuclease [Pseudomonas sp. zfem005]